MLRGGRGHSCRVADHNLSEWLYVLKMCVLQSQRSLWRAQIHATYYKIPGCLSSPFVFLHVCWHIHTPAYCTSQTAFYGVLMLTKRPHGAESRSVGDSLSPAQAHQNKGGTVSLGITHFEFQVYLNQIIRNIFMGEREICFKFWRDFNFNRSVVIRAEMLEKVLNKPNCGCLLPVHSQTVGVFIMWFFIYQQCFANC